MFDRMVISFSIVNRHRRAAIAFRAISKTSKDDYLFPTFLFPFHRNSTDDFTERSSHGIVVRGFPRVRKTFLHQSIRATIRAREIIAPAENVSYGLERAIYRARSLIYVLKTIDEKEIRISRRNIIPNEKQ